MDADEARAKVDLANTRYLKAKAEADQAANDLFDAYANAARAGHTADSLAQDTAFTAAYIRKQLRARGVEPRKGGPKPRKQ
ncbi:hypothetical protein ACFVH6_21730 [Spirillospora sp. NPDC127200]